MITSRQSRLHFKIVSLLFIYHASFTNYYLILAPKKIYGLNNKLKKEEGLRIDHENMLMLNRLIQGKSTFSVDKWEQQHRKRQKLLQRCIGPNNRISSHGNMCPKTSV